MPRPTPPAPPVTTNEVITPACLPSRASQPAGGDCHDPDVTVYRAEALDITPTRPEHVLLVVDVVSPGSETTDRIVKVDQYARAGIPFYWRVEQAATGVPLVYTYILDPAAGRHRDGDVFTGIVKLTAPFAVEIDLGRL
ncbi:Uma2 family endonuclease [Actinoplanes subglobosus]|uniref:Uma2 family endonuclease n=1 Tax=Actinoplanes subglobosus TaxID=1547892 RepID=A0ABV8J8J9_9ACTN